jgi:uncharacterized protein YndB with AHSA1/START domain
MPDTSTRPIATLLEASGRWTLRFERNLAHPIDKVWRCLTEPEHRDAWWPSRIEGDLIPGGDLRFVGDPNLPEHDFTGRCLAIEPPHLLELLWGDDTVRIELAADGDRTRMVFLDSLHDRRHAARDGSGWHECLDHLHAHLDGTTVPEMDEARWNDLHGRYLEAVGGDRHVWGQEPDLS